MVHLAANRYTSRSVGGLPVWRSKFPLEDVKKRLVADGTEVTPSSPEESSTRMR
jgi:hypothetical protein